MKKAGNKKALDRGDEEGDGNVIFTAAKIDQRSPNRQERAQHQCNTDDEIGADVLAHILEGMFVNRAPAAGDG